MTSATLLPLVRMDRTPDWAVHGNALPLLHEIRHALIRLLESGEPTCIDLRALPMGPGDEVALEAALGIGEVEVTLNTLGPSSVVETAYPGVWLVTHRNEDGQTLSRFVEVAFVPAILESAESDVMTGLMRLGAALEGQPQPLDGAMRAGDRRAGR